MLDGMSMINFVILYIVLFGYDISFYFPCNFSHFFLCVFYLILVSFQPLIFLKIFFYYCRRSRAFICYLKMWEFIEAFLFLVYWLYLFLTFSFFLYTHSQMRESSCRQFLPAFPRGRLLLYPLLKHLGTNEIIFLVLLLEVNFMCLCQLSS